MTTNNIRYGLSRTRLLHPLAALIGWILLAVSASEGATPLLTIYPAPPGAALSDLYSVQVQGQAVPVYALRVAPEDPERRRLVMEDRKNTGNYYDLAAFTYFDIAGPVQVSVTCKGGVKAARVLPNSFGVHAAVEGDTVRFTIKQPQNLTLEVNHQVVNVLHLFANPVEDNAPSPNDSKVVYFGPGIHEVSHQVIRSGQTVYLAGGAIVRGILKPEETATSDDTRYGYSLKGYKPVFELLGDNIQFRGRGILDGSLTPAHAKNLVAITGKNFVMSGVILQDPSIWTMPMRNCHHVMVENVKILGYRGNSDGMDFISCSDVTVQNCFIRTLDDEIDVKSHTGYGGSSNIIARHNVLWNEGAHAMTVGTDAQKEISGIRYVDNDISRDLSPNYSLLVYQGDIGLIHDIVFERIRINQDVTVLHGGLIGMIIRKVPGSQHSYRSPIRDVSFKDIQAIAYEPTPFPQAKHRVQLIGENPTNGIEQVRFEKVVINGKPLLEADIHRNRYVKDITVRP